MMEWAPIISAISFHTVTSNVMRLFSIQIVFGSLKWLYAWHGVISLWPWHALFCTTHFLIWFSYESMKYLKSVHMYTANTAGLCPWLLRQNFNLFLKSMGNYPWFIRSRSFTVKSWRAHTGLYFTTVQDYRVAGCTVLFLTIFSRSSWRMSEMLAWIQGNVYTPVYITLSVLSVRPFELLETTDCASLITLLCDCGQMYNAYLTCTL